MAEKPIFVRGNIIILLILKRIYILFDVILTNFGFAIFEMFFIRGNVPEKSSIDKALQRGEITDAPPKAAL